MPRFNVIGQLDPNNPNNIACNCFTGTAVMVNGRCTCVNDPINTIPPPNMPQMPPMPTTLPPIGYYWFYSAASGRWIPKRKTSITSSPNDHIHGVVGQATNWIKTNPVLAIGLAISAYVAFIKK